MSQMDYLHCLLTRNLRLELGASFENTLPLGD
jgi:hypothetical protein